MCGPPPYGEDAWNEARELQWARDSYQWGRSVLGQKSVVASAALHRDETAPHIHVLAVPLDRQGKLGWCRVRDQAIGRISPGERIKGSNKYRTLQNDYHAHIGKRYGLGRGEIGSTASHEAIDRSKAAEARARQAEKEVEAARQRGRHRRWRKSAPRWPRKPARGP